MTAASYCVYCERSGVTYPHYCTELDAPLDAPPIISPDSSCPWCKLGWPSKEHPVKGVCGCDAADAPGMSARAQPKLGTPMSETKLLWASLGESIVLTETLSQDKLALLEIAADDSYYYANLTQDDINKLAKIFRDRATSE